MEKSGILPGRLRIRVSVLFQRWVEEVCMPMVKVYSTPTCPWCKRTKEFLEERNVQFEDVNVAENLEAAKEMVEKSGQMGVPVIEIDGQIVVGFDKQRLEDLLLKSS
jgi:glutaredoxin 3